MLELSLCSLLKSQIPMFRITQVCTDLLPQKKPYLPRVRVHYKEYKNSIRDARTPQPGKIAFNTVRYRSSETVQRTGYFQSSVNVQIMFKKRK